MSCQSRHHFCLNFDFGVFVGFVRAPRKRNSQKISLCDHLFDCCYDCRLAIESAWCDFFRSLTRYAYSNCRHRSFATHFRNKQNYVSHERLLFPVSFRFFSIVEVWKVGGRFATHTSAIYCKMRHYWWHRSRFFNSEEILIFHFWFIWPRETCHIGVRRQSLYRRQCEYPRVQRWSAA